MRCAAEVAQIADNTSDFITFLAACGGEQAIEPAIAARTSSLRDFG